MHCELQVITVERLAQIFQENLDFSPPPFFLFCSTFGMVDSEETCILVMVYNTANSWGVLIGDTVVIPEPLVKRNIITHKDEVSVS